VRKGMVLLSVAIVSGIVAFVQVTSMAEEEAAPSDIVALLRLVEATSDEQHRDAAVVEQLVARFPIGSDVSALIAFITQRGPSRQGECMPGRLPEGDGGGRYYYCRISYGSLLGRLFGTNGRGYRERVIGIRLRGDTNDIARISSRVPLLGKG